MAISFPNSEELIDYIRSKTDTVFLSWSNGKDCIAAYLAIRGKFKTIIPFHLYTIPGLEFVEQSLTYYEGIMGCRIHRLPHPSTYRFLEQLIFQAPENCAIIQSSSLQRFTYNDCVRFLIEDYGYPETAWIATGVRAVDSPIRLASIKRYGTYNEKRRTFFPVWDWRKQRLRDFIKKPLLAPIPDRKSQNPASSCRLTITCSGEVLTALTGDSLSQSKNTFPVIMNASKNFSH